MPTKIFVLQFLVVAFVLCFQYCVVLALAAVLAVFFVPAIFRVFRPSPFQYFYCYGLRPYTLICCGLRPCNSNAVVCFSRNIFCCGLCLATFCCGLRRCKISCHDLSRCNILCCGLRPCNNSCCGPRPCNFLVCFGLDSDLLVAVFPS